MQEAYTRRMDGPLVIAGEMERNCAILDLGVLQLYGLMLIRSKANYGIIISLFASPLQSTSASRSFRNKEIMICIN